MVLEVITPQDTEVSHVPTATVYEQIISDLTDAAANLSNTYRTRASRAAAQALLAKVHLTVGNYGQARTLLESVISSGNYSLESNFSDVFYNENNAETIFAIGYARRY